MDKVKILYANNGQPVTDNNCHMQDHKVIEFKVTIQTMGNISEDTIKAMLQEKFKVLDCQTVETRIYVR